MHGPTENPRYLITSRVLTASGNAAQVKNIIRDSLADGSQPEIQRVAQSHTSPTNWNPAQETAAQLGIPPGNEYYVTHRLFVLLPEEQTIRNYCAQLHAQLAELIAHLGPSQVLDVKGVLDPMRIPLYQSTEDGIPASNNAITCNEPPYFQ